MSKTKYNNVELYTFDDKANTVLSFLTSETQFVCFIFFVTHVSAKWYSSISILHGLNHLPNRNLRFNNQLHVTIFIDSVLFAAVSNHISII